MKREELKTKDFNYHLSDDKIAKFPLNNRNNSKLVVYKNGLIGDDTFSNLQEHLPKGATLVFNDTKVIAARLQFIKDTGAKIEVFCLEPHNQTVEESLNETNSCIWKCMIGNQKRFTSDTVLKLTIANSTLQASIHQFRENDVLVKFEWESGISFSQILDAAGEVPLPPYLNRSTESGDKDNYQTVYARNEGAVAAPTAGLHFIPNQLDELKKNGHHLEYLTLFVGAGTFKVVKADKLVDHEMHKERIVISKSTIEQLLKNNNPVIAVGTTSLRSLESLYWMAVKMSSTQLDNLHITQTDAYNLKSDWSFKEACEYLIAQLESNDQQEIDFTSSLFIMPGYEWKAIDGIITNFHQPNSTLLALIASWVGDDWKKIYQHALENNYRFLSYGDSSLLLK